jgi:hypothetical protein
MIPTATGRGARCFRQREGDPTSPTGERGREPQPATPRLRRAVSGELAKTPKPGFCSIYEDAASAEGEWHDP